MSLEWEQMDAYHLRTRCRRFTICRCNVGSRVHYEAWKVPPRGSNEAAKVIDRRVVERANMEGRERAVVELKAVCEAAA